MLVPAIAEVSSAHPAIRSGGATVAFAVGVSTARKSDPSWACAIRVDPIRTTKMTGTKTDENLRHMDIRKAPAATLESPPVPSFRMNRSATDVENTPETCGALVLWALTCRDAGSCRRQMTHSNLTRRLTKADQKP